MKKAQLIWLLLFPFAFGIALESTWAQQSVTTNQPPATFVYVKAARQKVKIKYAGQDNWVVIQKFAALLPGDSLRVPQGAAVLLGDGSAPWRRITGPKAMIITQAQNKRNQFGRYIDYLYEKFFVERYARRFSRAGVRSSEALFLAMPDTSFVHTMPERIHWRKSALWRTVYQVQITHNHQAVLDTEVTGNTLENIKPWQQTGDYHVKVTLSRGALLGTETDSCVIRLLPEDQSAFVKSKLDELQKQAEKKARREDYLALVDFCLREKLYLDLEQHLISMIKKFPDDHEAQAMLFAYYASFMPEEAAEQLSMERLKELQ